MHFSGSALCQLMYVAPALGEMASTLPQHGDSLPTLSGPDDFQCPSDAFCSFMTPFPHTHSSSQALISATFPPPGSPKQLPSVWLRAWEHLPESPLSSFLGQSEAHPPRAQQGERQ